MSKEKSTDEILEELYEMQNFIYCENLGDQLEPVILAGFPAQMKLKDSTTITTQADVEGKGPTTFNGCRVIKCQDDVFEVVYSRKVK